MGTTKKEKPFEEKVYVESAFSKFIKKAENMLSLNSELQFFSTKFSLTAEIMHSHIRSQQPGGYSGGGKIEKRATIKWHGSAPFKLAV